MSTDLSLERAIQALRTGDRETARALLHQLTQAEPLKPEGWLWLAAAQDDPLQKRVCLQQVLALDPGNQRAAAGLRALEQQQTGKRARRISWPIVALVGALIILIPLAIWLLGQTQSAQASASAWAILLVVEGGAIWPEIELVQPADDSLH
jgi:hypothetical protein